MTSTDAEKVFDKVQHLLLIKMLSKVVMEGEYINIIKAVMRNLQPTSYSMGKIERLSPKIKHKTGASTFTTFIQHSILEVLATGFRKKSK